MLNDAKLITLTISKYNLIIRKCYTTKQVVTTLILS
jgi:hypothetical protein